MEARRSDALNVVPHYPKGATVVSVEWSGWRWKLIVNWEGFKKR